MQRTELSVHERGEGMTTKEIEQVFDISNMLPNRVFKDDAEILQFIKHCVGISKAFTDSFTIDKSVIEDIKAEIDLYLFQNEFGAEYRKEVSQIIDKHIGGNADESNH